MPQEPNVFINLHDGEAADMLEVTDNNPFPVKIVSGVEATGYLYKYIVTQITVILKNGAGLLHSVTINTPVAAAVMTIYDDVSAVAANKIAVITLPGTLLSEGPMTAIYDVRFSRGLTIVTSGANGDWTVAYL